MITKPIDSSLKVGDQVLYRGKTVDRVVSFTSDYGNIAILESLLEGGWLFEGANHNGFIWRFNTNGKGDITYNDMFEIIVEDR